MLKPLRANGHWPLSSAQTPGNRPESARIEAQASQRSAARFPLNHARMSGPDAGSRSFLWIRKLGFESLPRSSSKAPGTGLFLLPRLDRVPRSKRHPARPIVRVDLNGGGASARLSRPKLRPCLRLRRSSSATAAKPRWSASSAAGVRTSRLNVTRRRASRSSVPPAQSGASAKAAPRGRTGRAHAPPSVRDRRS